MIVKMRPALVVVFLLLSAVLMNGCSTAKGVAVGAGATAMGVAEDTKGLWHGIQRLDAWIKKNLW